MPQEFTFKFEGLQSASLPAPQTSQTAKATPGSNIPRPPIAGFVARRDTNGRDIVERLKEELAPEKNQLIVLWGAGGVGKTTLAAETARLLRDMFSGGIIWTSAEGRSDFSLSTLLDEIATHLGREDLRQLATEPKDEAVHEALASASATLIVLDNFETISVEEQDKCAEWLAKRANCPALITTRDEVAHARPIHILAMSLPEAHEFLQNLMAQVRNPQAFKGLAHEQIIEAADRLPLVLQWVVKRIDSAKQPQAVLDDLAHGEGDAAKRVFDRSFDLPQVGDDGRAVLLALSLFVPSASRRALAEVAGLSHDNDRLDRAIQQLAELRLIAATEGNERLSVEGLTRELTKSRMSKDQRSDEFAKRFVIYFRADAEAHRETTPEDFEALETEKENLLNAIDVASKIGDWKSVMVIRSALEEFLDLHGYWEDALRTGKQALRAARKSELASSIRDCAHNLGVLYLNRGELDEAQRLYSESLEISRKLEDQAGIAIAAHQLGRVAENNGNLDEAHGLYIESLEIERKLGRQVGIAYSLGQLGNLARLQGAPDQAMRFSDESLEIFRGLGDRHGIAKTLHQLAMLDHDRGELDKARLLFDESLKIKRTLGDQVGIASTLHQLGRLAEDEGKSLEAMQLFTKALAILEKLKSPLAEIARRSVERIKGKS
ncbi:MAG TPA: tetratricopeptide repeat protein [Pyrinomonadaceae bacterium]|nr:tetratricopeptide repeat protein [Pyrinomonadaceae bacterium]